MEEDKNAYLKEVLYKEIDLIQACITRMAQNSFTCKGWNLTLLAALLALSKDVMPHYITGSIMVYLDLCFWGMDAFFLQQERKYREKYKWVIKNRLITDNFLFDLNPNNEIMISNTAKVSYFQVVFSKTLWPMYAGILVLSVIYIFI